MSESRHSDFLKLPRELRDETYGYALCSFSQHRDQCDIEQCADVCSGKALRKRQFTGNLNLLLANKQIHKEGYKCMMENLFFVLIQSRSLPLGPRIYGHKPIFALRFSDHPRVEHALIKPYPWYVMRLVVELKDEHLTSREWKQGYYSTVMLLEDCTDMFKRFNFSVDYHILPDPTNRQDMWKIVIELHPKIEIQERKASYTDLWTSHPAIDQRKLLEYVKGGLRDCPDLEIQNCDDEALIAEVKTAVSSCDSIGLDTLRTHLESHARSAKASWESGNFTECANFCANGIELLQRVRLHFPLVHTWHDDGLEEWLDVSRSSYTLQLLLVRCTFAYLPTFMDKPTEADNENRVGSIAHSLKLLFERHDSRALRLLRKRHLPTDEQAEEFYLKAKAIRLEFEYSWTVLGCDRILDIIGEAIRLQPGNSVYEEEERKASAWIEDYMRFQAWLDKGRYGLSFSMPLWRTLIDRTKFQL